MLMAEPGSTGTKKSHEEFSRNVILLKPGDFPRTDGHADLPTFSELSKIRNGGAQYKRGVEFASSMSPASVRKTLQKSFPYLEGRSFSCAGVVQVNGCRDVKKFEFYGDPRLWDGKTIKRNIKGNSSLYILEDGQTEAPMEVNENRQGATGCTYSDHREPEFPNHTPMSRASGCTYSDHRQPGFPNHTPMPSECHVPASSTDNTNFTGQAEVAMEINENRQGETGCTYSYNREPEFPNYTPMSSVFPILSFNEGIGPSYSTDNTAFTGQVKMPDCSSSSQEVELVSDVSISTSGYSEEDFGCTEEELSLKWIQEGDIQFEVNVTPNKTPLQGGDICRFTFNRMLPLQVHSGFAIFGHLGSVTLDKFKDDSFIGSKIPPASEPGWVTIILQSQWGVKLGETKILYVDQEEEFLEQVVREPKLQKKLFLKLGESTETSSCETQNSGNVGSTQPVQVLRLLVYTAAEIGAQQFLEMIFSTSAGRVVFDAYKDSSQLPEVIARKRGHEETANYLEDITARFFKEVSCGQEWSQTIRWTELVEAVDAVQRQSGLASVEENNQFESDKVGDTDYFGDNETSSSDSSELPSSDFDSDGSETPSKDFRRGSFGEDRNKDTFPSSVDLSELTIHDEEKKKEEPGYVNEGYIKQRDVINDQTSGYTFYSPITALSDRPTSPVNEGVFSARNQGNAVRRHGTDRVALYENCVQITKKKGKKEILDVQQDKCLHQPDISFLLGINTDSIARPLSTMLERFENSLQFTVDWGQKTEQCWSRMFRGMTLSPASGQLSLTCPDVMVESNLVKNSDSKSTLIIPLRAVGQLSLSCPDDMFERNLVTGSDRKSSATKLLQQVTCNPRDGDESFKKYGGRKPIVRKQYININNKGQVAVASRSAKVIYHTQPTGKVRIGVARPSPDEYDEEGISTGKSPPDTARYEGKPQFESTVQGKQRERKHSALIGDIEVEKVSDNESSGSEDEDRLAKFDFGPPLLFSGDSMDLDSLPDNIKSRMETITIRRQMVGKLGVRLEGDEDGCGCEVTSVLEGMAVGLDGRIKVGDRIVAVNDASMIGLSGLRARSVLRNQASDSSRKDIVFTFIPSDIQQSPSSFLEDTSTSSMEAEPEQRRDELEEHKIPPQGVGDPPDLLQPVRPPIYEEPGFRVVELAREPNSALGIIIEGGKVGTEDLGLRGIFIRHIDMSSPAARVGTLLTGDQILEVNVYNHRDASHDKAVEIIKHAKNPVRFVIRTVASSTGLPPKTPVTPEVTHDNQVEPSSVTVTSARPSAEPVTLPPDKSLRKDIPIAAKHLSTKSGEPITSVVKSGEVKAEIESKRLILPPRLTMVKSEEDRKRLSIAGGKGTAANRSFDVDVKPGGPAEKNGKIQQADEILEVNDVTIRALTHYEASAILKNTPPEVELVLGRSQEAADFLRTPPAHETPRGGQFPEPKAKALSVGSTESSPTAQRRQTESSGPSGPSPTSSPPPVTGVITVSPTLLKELSGGRQLEFVDFIKSSTGLGFAVVERPGFVEGQTGIYVKDITKGGPAQKDNRLRKGDQLIVVDNQPIVGHTHAEAVAILKRTNGKVSLVVARKQTQLGSASAPGKATASVPPRRETGNPRTPKRGPPVAKKPVRDSLSDPKLHGSPRKPASPEETKKPIESMPTGSLISPRKQPVKPEPLEPEIQLIQHSPKETAGLSIAGGKGAAANRSFVADVKPGGPVEKNEKIQQEDEIVEVNDVTIRGFTHYEASAIRKDNCLRKGDQLIAVDNQPIVRLTHAQAARKQTQPGSALAPEKATASVFPKRETGRPGVPKRGPPVAKKPVRKQTQPGSALAPEKATASVSPRRETGRPGVLKGGPSVPKKPVGDFLTYLKKPGSPRKPASLEGGKEAYERMPTGKPVVPRIRLVKLEAAEREFQGVQQPPRETADLSDTSSITSDTSSLTSDESWTGGRKPVYKFKLSHISGQVVVGSKSKLIYTHPKDGDNRDVTRADKSDSPAPLSKEGSENDKFQDKNATIVSEPILGSYCLSNYSRLEDIEKEEECNLKPCRGIIICKGDQEDQWSLQSFFKDPDRFI